MNNESQHLIISGVPKLGLTDEVTKLARPYGDVKTCSPIPGYPAEEFTEAYHVRYARIPSARVAKRFIDGKNFFGGSLHVFYAPELESVSETRLKLAQRRRDIATRIKKQEDKVHIGRNNSQFISGHQHRFATKQGNWTGPLTGEQIQDTTYLEEAPSSASATGDLSRIPAFTEPIATPLTTSTAQFEQAQIPKNDRSELIGHTRKRKNYKGRSIRETVKVRVVRPDAWDASSRISNLSDNSSSNNLFVNTKSHEKNIVIKLLPKNDEKTKRIVINNPEITQLVQPNDDLRSSIRLVKSQIRAAVQNVYRAASPLS